MCTFEFFALLFSIIGLFIWNRTESRADIRYMDGNIRHMDSKLEIYLTSMREETKIMQNEIRAEMKDFHGRLCAIEERGRK